MNLEEENKMTESLKGKKKNAKELIQQTFGASPTCTGVTNTNFELRNSEFKVLERTRQICQQMFYRLLISLF